MHVRRFVTGLAATGVLAAVPATSGAASSGAASSGAAPSPPRSQLAGFACTHALDPGSRAVGVDAVMRPLAGTRKLAIRFELLQRAGGASRQRVQVGDLGMWRSPADPTLGHLPGDVWRLQKSVYNLDVPFTYQFRVTFRWTGARGKVLQTTTRVSRTCRQREMRPDLQVTSIAVSAITGHPGQNLYTAVVANRGLTGAGPFQVLFAPGNTSAPMMATMSFLGPGKSRTLSFVGPQCDPANPPTVSADSASQIDDLNRANNVMPAACPAS
ncbi:MAG: CARDB domain-containing protein [Solirubrobacteraceae bacterium]